MQSAALSSATQHAMPPELGGKSGTECLNTRFPLPTLLCAGYSVKIKKKYIYLNVAIPQNCKEDKFKVFFNYKIKIN